MRGVVKKLYDSVLDDLSLVVDSGRSWTLYVLFVFIVGNYVTTPLGWDQQINVAFAQQAARFHGSFPANIVDAWTLRGVGYKLLVYVPYVVAESLVGYQNRPLFELVYRLQMAIFYIGIICLSVAVSRSRLESSGYDVAGVTFLLSAAFLTLSHWIAFQPDDIAALITILGIALAISEYRTTTVLSGFVFALLVTIKGITILFIPLGYLLILAFEGGYRRYYPRLLISTIVFGIAILGCLLVFAPATILDLLEGAKFQSTLGLPLIDRLRAVTSLYYRFYHLPILVPASIAGVVVLFAERRLRYYHRVSLLVLLATIPLGYVFLQAKGFGYHFVVLVPMAIGLYFWVGAYEQKADGRRYSAVLVAVLLAVAAVTVTPVGVFESASADDWKQDTRKQAQLYADLKAEANISESTAVLYLADGTATYHLGAKSHLRYYYPLPVQRANNNDQVRQTKVFNTTYQKMLAYDGEYVLVTEWMALSQFPKLQTKLESEYCPTYRGTTPGLFPENVTLYQRKPADCLYTVGHGQ